jgi:hypothetical protein
MSYLTDIDTGLRRSGWNRASAVHPGKNHVFCPAPNEARAADSVEIAAGDFNP